MNRELIKSMSINSKVYENISIDGFDIPLILAGTNGVYLCLEGNTDINSDVELFKTVKRKFNLSNSNCFLFKFLDDATDGYFYAGHDGEHVSVIEDIYGAFKTCYDFATLYLSGGADKSVVLLLESVGV